MKNEDKKGYKSVAWRRNTAYISPLAATRDSAGETVTENKVESDV